MEKYEVLEGEICEIIYHNEDNGYTVCVVDTNEGEVCVVGSMPFVAAGESIRAFGKIVLHADYGEQFKAASVERIVPKSVSSILTYLSSGVLPGVRTGTARKIVDLFGEMSLDVIRSDPERLATVSGISLKKAHQISEAFLMRQDAAETVMFMQNYGVTPNMALKVYKKFGSLAIDLIRKDPYSLCEKIEGISFVTADRIASEMDFPIEHPSRLRSGIKYILLNAAFNGHSCLPETELREAASRDLHAGDEAVSQALAELVLSARVIREGEYIYLPAYLNAERYCAARLRELSRERKGLDGDALASLLDDFESDRGIKLSKEQRDAVFTVNHCALMILTGGPGTGKTTIINAIIAVMRRQGLEIALTAPTGKAAKRLGEACESEAKTIHRLLEATMVSDTETAKFSRNEENPLSSDVVIVDEMSMVDVLLMADLLRALKRGARLVVAGDVDQLPSVGAGCVLKDMINSHALPVVRLESVFRQASESMIVTNAHRINNGEYPLLNVKGKDFFFIAKEGDDAAMTVSDLCAARLPKAYGFDILSDIQVLSPSKRTALGTTALNTRLQSVLNPPDNRKAERKYGSTIFRVGDKVIQTKNDYELPWTRRGEEGGGIYNGDIGIIRHIYPHDGYMQIEFDDERMCEYDFSHLEELELAYALTVHKAQGCEFRAVIVPVTAFAPMLMTRNLLYTAVTRARELVVLVGSERSIARMVENNRETARYSTLAQKIRDEK